MAGKDFRVYWLRLSWELTLIEGLLTKSSEGVIVGIETKQWLSKIKYFIFEIKYCSSTIFFFKTVDFPSQTIYRRCSTWSLGFPGSSADKESVCNTEDLGSIPGLERSPGEGNSYPLQYSGLEDSMGSQRVGKDWETFTFGFNLISREPQSLTPEQ